MKKSAYLTTSIISVVVLLILSFIFITKKVNNYIIDDLKNNNSTLIKDAINPILPLPDNLIISGTLSELDRAAGKFIVTTGNLEKYEFLLNKNTKLFDIDKQLIDTAKLENDLAVKVQAVGTEKPMIAGTIYIIGRPSKIDNDMISPTSTLPISTPESKNISDKIRVEKLKADQVVTSPLLIDGEARGSWYFEGIFQVRLQDSSGKIIAQENAEAIGDWMTTDFVPFNLKLEFIQPQTDNGKLIFIKNNPSGLPANDEKYEIPVRFK